MGISVADEHIDGGLSEEFVERLGRGPPGEQPGDRPKIRAAVGFVLASICRDRHGKGLTCGLLMCAGNGSIRPGSAIEPLDNKDIPSTKVGDRCPRRPGSSERGESKARRFVGDGIAQPGDHRLQNVRRRYGSCGQRP